jgi:hypothetical protein
LLQLPQCLRLQRLRERFHWRLSQLRLLHWQPLSLQSLWWSLQLPLPGLRLVLPQLLSVAPVLLACSMQLLLLPVRFAPHWLLPLPCLQLQQPLSRQRPSRLLCPQSSLRWLSPLQLPK